MHRDFMECLKAGIIILDESLRVESIDEEGCKILGCTAEEIIGRHYSELLAEDIEVDNFLSSDSIINGKTSLKWNGNEISACISVIPVNEKRFKKFLVTFKSVHKCIQCLKKLEEQERIFRVVFDSVGEGIFTVNEDLVITSFNKAAERITGFKREEVIGKKCFEVFRSFNCSNACPLKSTLQKMQPMEDKEVVIKNKEGKKVFLSVSTSVLVDHEGKAYGCVETFREIKDVHPIEGRQRCGFGRIVGNSIKMQAIFEKLPIIADSDLNVLIQGETGTGKDLLARTIHEYSQRRDKPFVKISCASIPDTLLESELFGYKKGAFTGALRDKPGKLEICNGGTIYLDEVADMPPHLQVKLLRVVEEREFEKLGDTKTVKVDVRIIAATNKNLEEEVRKGKFREDLYYRLNVLSIELPPLRERKEDIPLLIEHFIDLLNKKRGKDVIGIDEEALQILCAYHWPGNIRELQNVMEYIFVHINTRIITVDHLPPYLKKRKESDLRLGTLAEMEEELIRKALKETGGNKNKAAKILGIPRTTLWRKMKKYGIYTG